MGGNFGRALGTAIPQALSNITSMQNLALREKEEQRAEETQNINISSAKIDLAKKQRLDEFNQHLMPLEAAFANYAPKSLPSLRKRITQEVIDGGYATNVNGQMFISPEKAKLYWESRKENHDFAKNAIEDQGNDLQLELGQVTQALNDPKTKPEDKIQYTERQKQIWKEQGELARGALMIEAHKGVIEGKYIPESYQEMLNSGGDFSKLKLATINKTENITGQFITNKGITVGFSDTGGAIAYTKDVTGNIIKEPYNQAKHGQKIEKPIATVNVTNKLETEEAKVIGQTRGGIYKQIVEASANAETSNFSLDEFEQYLNQVTTGKIAPTATSVAQWAKSFGIQIDPKWDVAQALDAVAKRFALSFRNPAGGSGMPGNFSDQDRKYLEAIAPGLGKSVEANRMIIDAMRKINNRRMETQQLADGYYDVHGTMKGFGKYMQDYANKNPLFTGKNKQHGNITKTGNRFTIKEIK